MYAPICTIDFQHEPIKPCKAVCERAKCGCEPVMKRYNHSWPDSLSCNDLPLYDRGVCISPEAIVKAEGPDRCRCKTVKLGMKTYLKNNYNYVIRARVREVRSRGPELTAVVDVKEVLKSSLVNIPKETQTLYYSSSCLCPPLSAGDEYLIMGYENEERSRLLLIEGSIAQRWKDKMGRKVKVRHRTHKMHYGFLWSSSGFSFRPHFVSSRHLCYLVISH
uniref:Frizzled related protein n=1 Tax=Myripristis murdjan TaxID=586833 RepID=A0A667WXP3_9TELE